MEKTENKWWVFNFDLTAYNAEEEYGAGRITYFFGTYTEAYRKATEELAMAIWNVPRIMYREEVVTAYCVEIKQALIDSLKKGHVVRSDYKNPRRYEPRLSDNNASIYMQYYYDMSLSFACLELTGMENKEYASKLTKAVWAFLKSAC